MKKIILSLMLISLIFSALPLWAQSPPRPVIQQSAPGYWYPPPRFQIFNAPGPYGGSLMLDTKTGETYQRVVVTSPSGITVRWIKLQKMDKLPEDEKILWK